MTVAKATTAPRFRSLAHHFLRWLLPGAGNGGVLASCDGVVVAHHAGIRAGRGHCPVGNHDVRATAGCVLDGVVDHGVVAGGPSAKAAFTEIPSCDRMPRLSLLPQRSAITEFSNLPI